MAHDQESPGPKQFAAKDANVGTTKRSGGGQPPLARAVALESYSPIQTAYIIFILMLVYLLAATDRNIMSILLVPVQNEIGASDAAMGALAGIAFSGVYAVAALPLARIADTSNRRNLLAISVAAWSAMTAVCAAVTGYYTLLLARMGVAAGEAAHGPTTLSMVGDLVPARRRGIAVSGLVIGTSLGIAGGAYVAGLTSDLYGWRTAFLVMGLPGFIVALLVYFTLPEPVRGNQEGFQEDAPPMWEGMKAILRIPTIPRLLCAKMALQMANAAFLVWVPAFFMRVHELSTSKMTVLFGLAVGLGSVAAVIIGGLASDWLSKRGERWRPYYCALGMLFGMPFLLMVIFGSTYVATIGLFLVSLVSGGGTAVSVAAGLSIVKANVRGLMTAMMSFCMSVVGYGLGPPLLGAITDSLKPVYGDMALRYSLIVIPIIWIVAIIFFWLAGRTTDRDVEIANQPVTTA